MYDISIPFFSEYKDELNEKYKALKNDYSSAKKMAEHLFHKNVENPEYNKKLLYDVDISALNLKGFPNFSKYEMDIENRIESLLNHPYLLDKEHLIDIFEARKALMELILESIDIDNIGTVLNELREFMEDVELDIERSKTLKINSYVAKDAEKNSCFSEVNYVDRYYKKLKKTVSKSNEWKVIYDTDKNN